MRRISRMVGPHGWAMLALWVPAMFGTAAAQAACDDACLTQIADQYRAAYVHHDPKQAPFAAHVRFMENNVELPFPDGSWDVVTSEVGPSLTFSDPGHRRSGRLHRRHDGQHAGVPRHPLRVEQGKIVEVEHLLSTKRLISAPPTPFGDVTKLTHDPLTRQLLTPAQRRPRAELIRIADGYFATLSHNDGTLHTQFAPTCHRIENGMETAPNGCEGPFKLGTYLFNVRVRREPVMVDEARGLVMFRGFIDHKGNVIDFKLTDGTRAHLAVPGTAYLELSWRPSRSSMARWDRWRPTSSARRTIPSPPGRANPTIDAHERHTRNDSTLGSCLGHRTAGRRRAHHARDGRCREECGL